MLSSAAFFSRQAWMAAATCCLSSLFFIQWFELSGPNNCNRASADCTGPQPRPKASLGRLFRICSRKFAKPCHGGRGWVLTIAVLGAAFGFRGVVILSHLASCFSGGVGRRPPFLRHIAVCVVSAAFLRPPASVSCSLL